MSKKLKLWLGIPVAVLFLALQGLASYFIGSVVVDDPRKVVASFLVFLVFLVADVSIVMFDRREKRREKEQMERLVRIFRGSE